MTTTSKVAPAGRVAFSCLAAGLFALANGCEPPRGASAPEALVSVKSALVSGASNVSDGLVPQSTAESQTAAVAMPGGFMAVVYNDFYVDPHDSGFRSPGISQVAFSYLTPNVTWRGYHVPTPLAVAALRFNPSIAYIDSGDAYTIYVSSVAYSPTVFAHREAYEVYASHPGDQLCVMSFRIPKDETAPTLAPFTCAFGVPPGSNYFDTTLLMIGSTPYLLAWDTASHSLHFFNGLTGAKLTSPLPQSAIGRGIGAGAVVVKGTAQSSIVAPDEVGQFWATTFNGSVWSTPATMSPNPSGYSTGGRRDYTAVVVPVPPVFSYFYLFYRQGTKIVGYSRGGPSPSLNLAFTSRDGFDAFGPAAEIAYVPNENGPFSGSHPLLTYWDNSGSGGALSLNQTWPGQPVTSFLTETPCPHDGYWGLRDEMAVRFNNTSLPSVWRFFTDSTHGTCMETEDWSATTVQHVSAVATRVTSCAHDPCLTGAKLTGSCNGCVQSICSIDSYCCANEWDDICVSEIQTYCQVTC